MKPKDARRAGDACYLFAEKWCLEMPGERLVPPRRAGGSPSSGAGLPVLDTIAVSLSSEGAGSPEVAPREEFVQLLIGHQERLFRYIATLLGNTQEATNLLQETNLVLWRKSHQFQPGTSFAAWARRVAFVQCQAYARDRSRDRLVFDVVMIEQLSNRPSLSDEGDDGRRGALHKCLGELRQWHRDLLQLRYADDLSVEALASRVARSPAAVKMALSRLRRTLLECVERRLAGATDEGRR